MYSINGQPPAVNICASGLESIRQPLLWLFSGVLIGIGFISLFSGGTLLLLAGLLLGVVLFFRHRGRWQGWPALLYGAGITAAVLLLPDIVRPAPCVAESATGCYRTFTAAVFGVALVLAVAGLALAVVELRRSRRS